MLLMPFLFNIIYLYIFLDNALSRVIFLINILPSKLLPFKTHFHIVYKSIHDYSNIMVFGCIVFASAPKRNISKLNPRIHKCLYLGNKHGVKRHILYELQIRYIFLSKATAFFETVFPFPIQGSLPINMPSSTPNTCTDINLGYLETTIPHSLAPNSFLVIPTTNTNQPSPDLPN